MGSTDTVAWEYIDNTLELVEQLKLRNIKIIAIEQAEKATMLNDFRPDENTIYALVFGNEVKGVAQDVVNASDLVVEILV